MGESGSTLAALWLQRRLFWGSPAILAAWEPVAGWSSGLKATLWGRGRGGGVEDDISSSYKNYLNQLLSPQDLIWRKTFPCACRKAVGVLTGSSCWLMLMAFQQSHTLTKRGEMVTATQYNMTQHDMTQRNSVTQEPCLSDSSPTPARPGRSWRGRDNEQVQIAPERRKAGAGSNLYS